MEKIIQFICENYQLLILLLACLLDLILFLVGVFKKKKMSPLGEVIKYIPKFIRYAEIQFPEGHGAEKKDIVIKNALSLYKLLTGVDVNFESIICKEISAYIEQVLDTPTKKGDK